ncbi:ankyrin repeat-containing domain protein [Lasiosphaeria hispida]|uniref:Ankyrin repeat-containing domain protein n=1 Tax=Lasiosphaeria hispida TaxID=260671 RepID=A0AAJ0HEU7_9PEZI|nr:ankyrin repeat-containing domain protein [Lasiosphaeria hispida]
MWLADFLENEGFDGTRISIFGATRACQNDPEARSREFHKSVAMFQKNSKLDHSYSVIFVEPLESFADSVAIRACQRQHENALPILGKAGAVLVGSDLGPRPGFVQDIDYRTVSMPLLDDWESNSTQEEYKFPTNSCPEYRSVVDAIWGLATELYWKPPVTSPGWGFLASSNTAGQQQQRANLVKQIGAMNSERLFKSLIPSEVTEAKDPAKHQGEGIEADPHFFRILNHKSFRRWLSSSDFDQAKPGILRVESSDLNLKFLCGSLGVYAKDYHVIHIDAQVLSKRYGQGLESPDGSSLIGPLLLTVFEFIAKAWAGRVVGGKIAGPPTSKLLQRIIEVSLAELKGSGSENVRQQLVIAMEHLGSNLAQVASDVLVGLKKDTQDLKVMILVSGLDSFMKCPELGRVIRCIRTLHRGTSRWCTLKTLFAHKQREDLTGLLGDLTSVTDSEISECLTSLGNSRLLRLKHVEARHGGTLDWFWKDKECQKWMKTEKSSILCLFGKPACGKSVLSKFIIDSTKAENCDIFGSQDILASFYFHIDQPDFCVSRTMLQELLHDILDQNPSFFPYFQSEYRKVRSRQLDQDSGRESEVWREEELKNVLRKIGGPETTAEGIRPYPKPVKVYLLVDGLDEATDPLACAQALTSSVFHELGGQICFKVLLTAREGLRGVDRCLRDAVKKHSGDLYQIKLQEKNKNDILEYTRSFLDDSLVEHLPWGIKDMENCRRMVVEQSCGIFLWAKLAKGLVGTYLNRGMEASLASFKRFLRDIPEDIDQLYSRLLARLIERLEDDTHRRESIRNMKLIFQIVLQARRSLSVEEFRDAYILPGLDQGLDDARKTNIHVIIPQLTGNFLEVHQREGSGHVGMLHPTAADFLRKQEVWLDGEPLLIPEDAPQLSVMANACLRFLELASEDLKANRCTPSNLTTSDLGSFESLTRSIDNYPFLVYALEHTPSHINLKWDSHAKKLIALLSHMSQSPIRFLLRDWMQKQAKSLPPAKKKQLPELKICTRKEAISFANCLLHCAAALRLRTAVKIAIAAGADIESRSVLHESRERAICLAIMPPQGRSEVPSESIVRILLQNGANPNASTQYQGTPLHYAGGYMRERVVELLLQNNANVHAKDFSDMTPLHRTVIGLSQARLEYEMQDTGAVKRAPTDLREASLACVELLARANADLQAVDNQGRKPIHWAAGLRGRGDILKFLVEYAGPSTEKKVANTKCQLQQTVPLHWASGFGHLEIVHYLLRKGAQAEWEDKRGKTAVNWAARYGRHDILKLLLDDLDSKGRNAQKIVNTKERPGGKTALMWSSQWNHTACVNLLIEARADVNAQEDGGRTALIYASREGHTDCMIPLLRAGANVNLAEDDDSFGGTPLSWAVTGGRPEAVELLLKHGAAIDDKTRPLLGWAAAFGKFDMFKKLRKMAADQHLHLEPDEPDLNGNTPFMLAASRGQMEMVTYLSNLPYCEANTRINIHHENLEGNTALLLAAGWARVQVVGWLVTKAGLDVNHVNYLGNTALHRAARWGHRDVIEDLLSRGARTNIRNNEGKVYSHILKEHEMYNEGL